MDIFSYSDSGNRPQNEDRVSSCQKAGTVFAMVADGLGGMGNGADAASIAVSTITQFIDPEKMDEDVLCDAIQLANEKIHMHHTEDNCMMTTVAAVWSNRERAFAATVGDTRIYQFRDQKIIFQTIDHSFAQMAVFSRKIRKEEIRSYPHRNRILRAVGSEDSVQIDLRELTVQSDDVFLICSDGFWELITEDEMEALLCQYRDPEKWLQQMKLLVMSRLTERSDNHSAIVIHLL